jgi:hypothetical protein
MKSTFYAMSKLMFHVGRPEEALQYNLVRAFVWLWLACSWCLLPQEGLTNVTALNDTESIGIFHHAIAKCHQAAQRWKEALDAYSKAVSAKAKIVKTDHAYAVARYCMC